MKNLIPEVIKEETVYKKFLKVTEATLKHGDREFSRERLDRPDAVAVLLINTDTEEFVMVNQYRYPISNKHDGPVIEIPAGLVGDHDEGEDYIEAAKRELEEEVGYKVEDLEPIYTYFPSVGYCNERIHLLIASVTNADKVSEGGGVDSEVELLEPTGIPVAEAYRMLDNGEFIDGKTIISLQALRSTWLQEEINFESQKSFQLEQKIKDLELKINLMENKPKEI